MLSPRWTGLMCLERYGKIMSVSISCPFHFINMSLPINHSWADTCHRRLARLNLLTDHLAGLGEVNDADVWRRL